MTWYERQQDDVGIRFNDAVDDVAARLPMLRLKPMKGFEAHGASRVEVGRPWPYRLVIIEHEATLFIVAVEHHRRRPGYWLARMSELDD